ncbi:DUF748 domain-containing protein [Flocculibacter collagenilyticus]|uniref:DUF748 domain-containing protein n=1 Tax=Flocculibacter collagenilyticus TaxID=2744479 RepID=UPI0018F5BC6F|nr:DUF748 domain-containing protein [Flocculibacter collagenilyticus]
MFRRLLVAIFLSLCVFLILLTAITPSLVVYFADDHLSQQNLQLDVKELRLNPITLELSAKQIKITPLNATGPDQDKPYLKITNFNAAILAQELLNKRLVIEQINLSDSIIEIKEDISEVIDTTADETDIEPTSHWLIAGYQIPTATEKEPIEETPTPSFINEWRFHLSKLLFDDVDIRIIKDGRTNNISIDAFEVSKFSLSILNEQTKFSGTINLKALVEKNPIDMDIKLAQRGEELTAEIDIKQFDLDFNTLKPYLLEQPFTLQGLLSSKAYLVVNKKKDIITAELSRGKFDVVNLDTSFKEQSTNSDYGLQLANASINVESLNTQFENEKLQILHSEIALTTQEGLALLKNTGDLIAKWNSINIPSTQFVMREQPTVSSAKIIVEGLIASQTASHISKQNQLSQQQSNTNELPKVTKKGLAEKLPNLVKSLTKLGSKKEEGQALSEQQLNEKKSTNDSDEQKQQLAQATTVVDPKTTPALLKLNTLSIENINFVENSLSIEDVALSDAQTNLFLDKEQQLSTLIAFSNAKSAKQDNSANDAVDTSASDAITSGDTISDSTISNSTISDNTTSSSTALEAKATSKDTALNKNAPKRDENQAQQVAEPDVVTAKNENNNNELTVFVGKIRLLDKYALHIKDRSVSPTFNKIFNINTLQVEHLSTIATPQPITLITSGTAGKYSRFNISASTPSLQSTDSFNIDGEIKELALNSLSGYLSKALGFDVKTGEIDLNINLVTKKGQLDGEAIVALRGMQFDAVEDQQTNIVTENSAMPFNMALAQLADKRGNLELEIPLSGDLSSPSFGMSSFIGLVTKKAVMESTKSYLMQTFVPYANVISVALMASDHLLKVTVNDLAYKPAQVIIDEDEQQAFVDEFRALMQKKKKLQAQVCPIVSTSDLGNNSNINEGKLDDEQKDELRELGLQRAYHFIDAVIEDTDISSSRMIVCTPKIKSDIKPVLSFEFK